MKQLFSHRGKKLNHVIIAIIIILVWNLFAPIQLGGNSAYVIIAGDSMSPKFIFGDLVITRTQSHYRIGDTVVYKHPEIGFVFHRIIAIDADSSYQLKGDHNDWIDSYHPTKQEIVGKLWLHIPKAGKFLETLRAPWGFAILSLIFIVLLYFSTASPKRKRTQHVMSSNSGQNASEYLLILGVLLLGALLLGTSAFHQPVQIEITAPLGYEEQAVFRYTADVPGGIYDSTQVKPGEPIFRRLNGSFSINMDYLFLSPYPNSVNGTYHLLARVSDSSGWKRTLELSPEETFNGNVFTTSGTLVLDDIQAFIDTLETETGVQRGRYVLSIITEIQTEGTLDGLPLSSSFSPSISFDVSNLEVTLRQQTQGGGSVLNPTQSNAVIRQTYEPNEIRIFGIGLPVLLARWIALVIGLPSLYFLLSLSLKIYRSSNQSELERLKIWYGSHLIEASDPNLLHHPNIVEIASLDGLTNLAEQDQRPILYLPNGNIEHLFVRTPEQLYHHAMDKVPAVIEAKRIKEPIRWRLPLLKSNNELKDAYEHALKGWAKAVEHKLYQEGEGDLLAEKAYNLAKALHIHGATLENIRMAAYLYKIGLMDVPDEILEKKNKLTKKELEILRQHPLYAQKQLAGNELLEPIAKAIYYQHEHWDGSGEPEGLKGEEIPIGSRIINVVNTWQGLSQARPYREAWTREKICSYFRQQSGKIFDPQVVETYIDMQEAKCIMEEEISGEISIQKVSND